MITALPHGLQITFAFLRSLNNPQNYLTTSSDFFGERDFVANCGYPWVGTPQRGQHTFWRFRCPQHGSSTLSRKKTKHMKDACKLQPQLIDNTYKHTNINLNVTEIVYGAVTKCQ